MPLTDPARIHAQRPRIVDLWQAMLPLRSCISFMNTGAHPDDEHSGMLAALRARGFDLSYACSTRGEGGQNDIGIEGGFDLGALRTAEMQRAAQVLSLRLYWLSESADDPITDFGFSKSGTETLAKWGRDRTLARFVHILRRERPDIICPTFLDVPGQHGHHRAMTEAAHLVMDLAADPEFAGCDLPIWQVKKLMLPAWSGAGQAYDDDLPPPPATTIVHGAGGDPVTGYSFAQIGQQSRVFHATQGMGRWVPSGDIRDWPLHLADCRIAAPDHDLASGLPLSLSDLAAFADAPELAAPLAAAQEQIDICLSALAVENDETAVRLSRALHHIREARAVCPSHAASEVDHRLARKEQQLATAIRLAASVSVAGQLADDLLRPGQTTTARLECANGQADEVQVTWLLPQGWQMCDDKVTVVDNAQPEHGYADTWLPDDPALPALSVTTTINGVASETRLPLLVPPVILPAHSASMSPGSAVLNLRSPRRDIRVEMGALFPANATPALALPNGWSAQRTEGGFSVTAPDDVAPGLYDIALTLDGVPAQMAQVITHPHIAPTARTTSARLSVRVVDVALPDARIGYFGGGNDRVAHWLAKLGMEVSQPDPATLGDAALNALDTIVIGIFALRFRPGLVALMPRLHEWVARGGTLLTLYHRPWDNWDPALIPPRPLEIGQPSLRWRVTDENAEVTYLAPDHPLLNTPNAIGADCWSDWHKERGLYFAKSWDAAYTPLLAMSDPDEAPQHGALLAADIDKGRHVHTSLILHHQMEHLTPGAFALMANLVARRT